MLFLKQKADGPLYPQQSHSIYDRRLAHGRGGLRISACRSPGIIAMPQIWPPGHNRPVKGSPGRQVAPPPAVPQAETKGLERNVTESPS